VPQQGSPQLQAGDVDGTVGLVCVLNRAEIVNDVDPVEARPAETLRIKPDLLNACRRVGDHGDEKPSLVE